MNRSLTNCRVLLDTILHFGLQSDDFFERDDLDEVFAEYFMSEPDELIAYTSSLINCDGNANDIDMDMDMDQMGSMMALDQRKPTQGPGSSLFQAMGGSKAVFAQPENDGAEDGASQPPPSKKAKQEGTDSCLGGVTSFKNPDWLTMMSQHKQMLNQDQQQLSQDQQVLENQHHSQQHTHQVQHNHAHAQQLRQIMELQAQADSCMSSPDNDGDTTPASFQSTPCDSFVESPSTMEGYEDHESVESRQKEKNRKYAKQFRVRTKSLFESLREELDFLKKQNKDLRTVVQEHIPDQAMQIIAECSHAANSLVAKASSGINR
jgi:hypothetical protein